MKLNSSRPIIIVSNSSWYILHYRKFLIQKLLKEKHHVLVISPYDSSSLELSKLCIHIPWRIKRIKSKQNMKLQHTHARKKNKIANI